MSSFLTAHNSSTICDFRGMSQYQILLHQQIGKRESNPLFCTTCQTQDYVVEDYSQGYMVCGGCGMVVQNQIISTEEEQRNFQNDDGGVEDKSRTSKASFNELLDGGLATSIAQTSKESGKLMKSQKKVNGTTKNAETIIKKAFSEISRFVDMLGAPPKSVFTIQQLFKGLNEAKRVNSKQLKSSIGACLFAGLEIEGHAITTKEVCVLVNIQQTNLNTMIMNLNKVESLKDLLAERKHSPKPFIETFVQKLSLPVKILTFALDICEKALNNGIDAGKSPSTIAAACIVFASQNHADKQYVKTEKDVEAVSGITRETIRKATKYFNMHKHSLLKDQ